MHRCINCRARSDAHQNALLPRRRLTGLIGRLTGDLHDFVVNAGIQHGRHKVCADALQGMGAGLAARQQRRSFGLYRHHLHGRIFPLEVLAGAGDGAAGAHTCHEKIHLPVGVLPNLSAGSGQMSGGVGGIVKLCRDKAAGDFFCQFLSLFVSTCHALGTGCEYHFCAIGPHQHLPLHAHGVGHDDDGAVATGGGDDCQTDAGGAGSGLDDGCPLFQQALFFGVQHHLQGHAVLDAAAGIAFFQLDQQPCLQIFSLFHAAKLQKRGLADQLIYRCIYFHKEIPPLPY